MTFSERAKPLKEKSKMTLLEIATACNISESMASRYINGQNIPPEDIARKMMDLLNAAAKIAPQSEDVRIDLAAIRSVYDARIADMKENATDLKAQLRIEKREKLFCVSFLAVIVVFVLIVFYIDITNGNVGWFRH